MIRRRYRCPECSGIFVYDHHPSVETDPLPDGAACPHCNFVPESEYPAAVVAPHIGRPIRATVDNLNRDMEDGATFRAQIAQEKFGLDAEAARAMTETNSRDYLREGDISAITVNNEVTRAIDANPQAYGWQGGNAQGAQLSGQVQGGPFPNAGLRALQQIRGVHPAMVASTGHMAPVTSSMPANEITQNPNYRPRI